MRSIKTDQGLVLTWGGGFTVEVISVKTGVGKVRREPPGSRVDFWLGLVERVRSGEGGILAQTGKDEMIGLDQTWRKWALNRNERATKSGWLNWGRAWGVSWRGWLRIRQEGCAELLLLEKQILPSAFNLRVSRLKISRFNFHHSPICSLGEFGRTQLSKAGLTLPSSILYSAATFPGLR